jgi:hypothetical protein
VYEAVSYECKRGLLELRAQGIPMSERMQHALQENPNASIEDIMLQEGQAHKFIGNLIHE